ncbi:hypothetical protein CNMCM5793_005723 [Aspergillus hiratsukae]|uniref:Nucleoside phosphorylase domain-containing protein n=1 Tax=Aspergillus hiratsukae TaxID=1194566 RepID=A0A8H6UJJ7_9EURO|nr:hypothetical protein CNMCM5793_005723 [Aspergillus hiratsukae]
MMVSLTLDDYTIAWICALPLEAAAARAMLDKTHTQPRWSTTDPNAYEFGELGGHYIVIAHLPDGVYGKVSAAAVVSRMRSTFRRLEFGVMVGIGGGVPEGKNDIRLGDVVVSKPGQNHSGVIQYDYGKAVQGGKFEQIGVLNKPPQIFLRHMSQFKARQMTAHRWHMSTKLMGITANFMDDSDSVVAAIQALGRQSPLPPEILEAVTCRLHDSERDVRWAAIQALGSQPPWPPEFLQAVTCRLDNDVWHVRRAAIEALGTQSLWPPEILEAVTCRLDDRDSSVRRVAINALGTQSPWPPEVLQAVTCRLDDDDWLVRVAAIDAIGRQSPWPPQILQAAKCGLGDGARDMRLVAINTLGRQSPWLPEILQAVTCRLDDDDWYVRMAAIDALGTQSPLPPEILQAVTCRLDDDVWHVR